MAISGCYGEPNFPRLIGLGLGIIFVTIPTDGACEYQSKRWVFMCWFMQVAQMTDLLAAYVAAIGDRYTKGVQMDTLNLIGFAFQWVVLVAVPVAAVLSGFQLKASVLVPLLMLLYIAFLAVSVACVYYEW
jgi:hypothetical protein